MQTLTLTVPATGAGVVEHVDGAAVVACHANDIVGNAGTSVAGQRYTVTVLVVASPELIDAMPNMAEEAQRAVTLHVLEALKRTALLVATGESGDGQERDTSEDWKRN